MRRATAVLITVLAGLAVPCPGQERRRVSAPSSFYDDADPSAPGWLNASQDISYSRVGAGHDFSFPSASFSVGVTPRLGFSASLGYTRSTFEQIRTNGIGDSYAGMKLLLVRQRRHRPALALKPMVEVLGKASISDNPLAPNRVNYVLPLIAQISSDSFRIYDSAGYFTRGIIFNSTVFELNRWSRITPVAVVSGSRMTRELGLISDLGLNRSRVDVTAGAAFRIRRHLSFYVNAGRTVGRADANTTRYQFTAGLSADVRLWSKNAN